MSLKCDLLVSSFAFKLQTTCAAALGSDIGEAIASCDAAAKHLAKSVGAAGETEAWWGLY